MKWAEFVEKLGEQPVLELSLISQVIDEPRLQIMMQMNRWVKAGKLLPVRRGMYVFSEVWRRRPVSPLQLANAIYKPSYLSGAWALSHYGLIPEAVFLFTSVTSRPTRRFHNSFGEFTYSTLKPGSFFGFSSKNMGGADVWMADPEKALLDQWHLHPGEWTPNRLEEMRYQNRHLIDTEKLQEAAGKFPPRVQRAAVWWLGMQEKEELEGKSI